MGRFANPLPSGAPLYVGVAPERHAPWHGQSGFAAMGKAVPPFRKTAAEQHLKEMGFTDAEQRYDIVAKTSERIARDDTHGAMEQMYELGLDVTGCYRILAVLLAAEKPEPEPAPEATFVDLVTQ